MKGLMEIIMATHSGMTAAAFQKRRLRTSGRFTSSTDSSACIWNASVDPSSHCILCRDPVLAHLPALEHTHMKPPEHLRNTRPWRTPTMTTLVVGATGMTGRLLVEQLLGKNHEVRVIVRSLHKLSAEILKNPNTTITEASVLDLTDLEMAEHVRNCEAVVSCLGHAMDFNGIFRDPKKLCTEATRRLCAAIEENRPSKPTKYILMNTVGVRNPNLEENRTRIERGLLFLLRHTVPPHSDNESAAEHLHRNVGKENEHLEWCSVRPDSLIDAEVSPYEIVESPATNILSGRPTARSNVAHFMAELVENADLWNRWKFRMPVIMNTSGPPGLTKRRGSRGPAPCCARGAD